MGGRGEERGGCGGEGAGAKIRETGARDSGGLCWQGDEAAGGKKNRRRCRRRRKKSSPR
jgi:hypothetical protein